MEDYFYSVIYLIDLHNSFNINPSETFYLSLTHSHRTIWCDFKLEFPNSYIFKEKSLYLKIESR